MLAAVLGLSLVAFVEASLTAVAALSPRVNELLAPPVSQIPPALPDPGLEFRPNPAYPGHDANGFRNPVATQATPEIVALGDSQTYGTGVDAEEAWPQRLGSLSKRPVYNMAFGGWGPTHGLIVLDRAIRMKPRLIVQALYIGNDLFDSFNMVYKRKQLRDMESDSAGVRSAIEQAEAAEPLLTKVAKVYAAADLYPQHTGIRHFLSVHSRTYGLLRATWYELRRRLTEYRPDAAWADVKTRAAANPAIHEVFDEGGHRTIFNSALRLCGMDLEDIRIAEGLRISLAAVERMQHRTEAGGIRFLVIILPTKQQVFRPFVSTPSANFRRVVENEDRILAETQRFLVTHGIDYLDTLPVLREQLTVGPPPFPASHDDHLNAIGQLAIATYVNSRLDDLLSPPTH